MTTRSMTEWTAAAPPVPHARPRRGASARSLLRTIGGEFMYATPGWTWTRTLLDALECFDVDEASARQAIMRIANDGWLERDQAGRRVRWRLSPAGWELTTDARARMFAFHSGRSDWNGRWLLVLVLDADERTRPLLRRRLEWAGFGLLPSGLAISPHVEREADARDLLESLDLADGALSFTATTGQIGAASRLITDAWDLDELANGYREFVAGVRAKRPRSGADFFVAHATLVHEWRRFAVLDPGLPLEFLPARWVGAEAEAVFRDHYDRWRPAAIEWFATLNADAG
jgi:phenylacetic acid degradation operon negative regulatory protein